MMPPSNPAPETSGPIAWFAANPVAANLLMLLILFGGVGSLIVMDKEVFPRFAPHQVEIKAIYPGAGPLEIEESVCVRIEEAIYDLPGIKRLRSEIKEGECGVNVAILPVHDKDLVMNAVRGRVQAIQRLPKASGKNRGTTGLSRGRRRRHLGGAARSRRSAHSQANRRSHPGRFGPYPRRDPRPQLLRSALRNRRRGFLGTAAATPVVSA
ncbi:efflux RND transporter permease subunit [Methylocaldum sp. MU1018]